MKTEFIDLTKLGEKEEQVLKPIKFTHVQTESGWIEYENEPYFYEKVVHLGHCKHDGDMFASYGRSVINIHKGHLNDGVIEQP